MPDTELVTNWQGPISYEKKYQVALESTGISSISANTLTFTKPHTFINGETIRVISQNGHLPDGLDANTVYFAITSGIGTNQVKIAQTLNDAVSAEAITINNKGGILDICLLYTSPSPRDRTRSRMPSSA